MFWQSAGESYHHVAGDGAFFYILLDRLFNFFRPSRNAAGSKSVDYWRNEMKEMFNASNHATLQAMEQQQEMISRVLSELVASQRDLNRALTEYIAFERGRREAMLERPH